MINTDGYIKLLKLCIEINENTEKAAFFNYSGHVERLAVSVASGKIGTTKDSKGYKIDAYNNRLYESYGINKEEDLTDIISQLKKFLPENK